VDEREHQDDAAAAPNDAMTGSGSRAADRDHVPRAREDQDQPEEGRGAYQLDESTVAMTPSAVRLSGSGRILMIEIWKMSLLLCVVVEVEVLSEGADHLPADGAASSEHGGIDGGGAETSAVSAGPHTTARSTDRWD